MGTLENPLVVHKDDSARQKFETSGNHESRAMQTRTRDIRINSEVGRKVSKRAEGQRVGIARLMENECATRNPVWGNPEERRISRKGFQDL